MKFSEIHADDLRHKSNDQVKRQFAELALAGLRRPVYTGAFRRLSKAKTRTYICDLIVDGYQRNLVIRLKAQEREAGQEDNQKRYGATIQGLPLALKKKQFNLVWSDAESGHGHLKGMLDISAAQLVMTVRPHRDVNDKELLICILEILRSEG